MNLLFMTIAYPKLGETNIYTDLMHEFFSNGHSVFVACSDEYSNRSASSKNEDGIEVIRIATGKLTGKVGLVKKGLATITLESKFMKAIKNELKNIKFDLVIYSTPPITFASTIKYLKCRDGAKTYLLLKDIFPQNAVDIGLIKRKSLIYFYFRMKEKALYKISDYIGCMSKANVDYVLQHNKGVEPSKVEICPNSITINQIDLFDRNTVKRRFNIPENCVTFIYGGNLGKPQNIDFVIECLKKNLSYDDRFFIICGNGSDYYKLEMFAHDYSLSNIRILNGLPKREYDELVRCCDIGLVFLDHRFTIPNFPSRLLSYMLYSMPILACSDKNTDIGDIIQNGMFGWWCESNNSDAFTVLVNKICCSRDIIYKLGINAREYLENNYTAEKSMKIILKHFT